MAERKRPSRVQYQQATELRAALRRFLRESERITRAHGLTSERYELLLFVRAASEGGGSGATVTSLQRQLLLAQTSVTQLVRRAEDIGLLQRELSKHDARVRYLHLTPEGQRRLAGAVAALAPERAKLLSLLDQLRAG